MKGRPVDDNDLQAYADGLLPQERQAFVEAELARDPELAGKVAGWQRQNEALRGLYAHVAREAVPASLSPYRIDRTVRIGRGRMLRMAAAAVLLASASATAGWYGRDLATALPGTAFSPEASLVGEAMAAHSLYTREVVHAVEVKADQEQHLASWLSKRLDRPLVVPDLSKEGLTFVGGRLLPANDGPAAQYMYEDASGRRVTLYIIPTSEAEETSLRYTEAKGLQSYLWTDNELACALVGDLPRAHLQQIAMSAYKQFE